MSPAIVPFAQDEFLPTPIPTGANDEKGVIVSPPNHPFPRSSSRDAWDRHHGGLPKVRLRRVVDFEVCGGEGVDVGKDAGEQGDFSQDAPFLLVAIVPEVS